MSSALNANRTDNTAEVPCVAHSLRREIMRLLWKETLALRGLLLFLVAVVAVVNGLFWLLRWEVSPEVGMLLLSLPQFVGVIFAIGCGAVLFSQEHELGTLELLRDIGVSPHRLVNAKLAAAAGCLTVLIGLATTIRWRPELASDMPLSDIMVAATSGGVAFVVLLWTSIGAMVVRRELITVCFGLGGALLLRPFVDRWQEVELLVLCLVLSIGLWLVCQATAARWLGSNESRWRFFGRDVALRGSSQAGGGDIENDPSRALETQRFIPVVAGTTIVVGVVFWLLLMMCWPEYSAAGRWAETLELTWSMLLGGLLGWIPVRCELRRVPHLYPSRRGGWQQAFATSSITWMLLWCLLSFGLLYAYLTTGLANSLTMSLHFCWDEVVPWLIVSYSSLRLMARICSGHWLAWPLSVIPLSIGWCAWWVLVMVGGPAWLGLLIISTLFGGASWCHRRFTQHERSALQATLLAGGGTIGGLLLMLGVLNWWRLADVPRDWTGGIKPDSMPVRSAEKRLELSGQRSELFRLVALISPAPSTRLSQGQEVPCFNDDWGVIEGRTSWGDVTAATRQWVESNESAIAEALKWQTRSQRDATDDSPATVPAEFNQPPEVGFWTNAGSVRSRFLWELAARRCEVSGQLDDAWRLHRLAFQIERLADTNSALDQSQYYMARVNQYWHYHRLADWVGSPRQTSARLKSAVAELLSDGAEMSPPEAVLADEFQRIRDFNASRIRDFDSRGTASWEPRLFRRLCLTETERERRIIDGLEAAHQVAFAELRPLSRSLSAAWSQLTRDEPPSKIVRPQWLIPSHSVLLGSSNGIPWVRGTAADLFAKTPRLAVPEMKPSHARHWAAVTQFLHTEGQRRAMLLAMAERAFRLDHDRPPNSSDELVPDYLPQRPVTVLTGQDLLMLCRRRLESPLDPRIPGSAIGDPAKKEQQMLWSTVESVRAVRLDLSCISPPRLVLEMEPSQMQ